MRAEYERLKKIVNRDGFGRDCHFAFEEMLVAAITTLEFCEKIPLNTTITGKRYYAFKGKSEILSRPVNEALICNSLEDSKGIFMAILDGRRHDYSSTAITQAVYGMAISCCAAVDVTSRGDRKTQGTVFEWLCAALIQSTLQVSPCRSLEILNLDLRGKLPTDFVFDMGTEKPKFHLPVKTSTRERIIQVWAHQRMLDGVYGSGRFLAMPIVLTETKLEAKTRKVIEICLPWQWRLYQMHIANLWNVCYLDLPDTYAKLNNVFPPVNVITVGDLLEKGGRIDKIIEAHGLCS
jgi:hypothetical protein